MERLRKGLRLIVLVLCLAPGAVLLAGEWSVKAETASEYEEVWDYSGNQKVLKSGKYYFRCATATGRIQISDRKNEGYRNTPLGYGSFGNGLQAYYVDKNVLYRYIYATRESVRLRNLAVSGDEEFHISTVYGNQIFLTKSSFEQWKYWTYSYNIKTGKVKKVMSNCCITGRLGKFVGAQNAYRTDVGPYPVTIYKITAQGLSKVRKLTSYGRSEVFVGKKLYYAAYDKGSMKKAVLYRCNKDGTGRKKIAVFINPSEFGEVLIGNITDKGCIVYQAGVQYRYTYAAKKMKRIR